MNIRSIDFFKELLRSIVEETSVGSVTLFEYRERENIIDSILRIRGDIISEHSEYIYIKDRDEFYESVLRKETFISKKGRIVFVYIPFDVSDVEGEGGKRYIFRIERFDGKRFSIKNISKVIQIIKSTMNNYARLSFDNMRDVYSKGIGISAALGGIFGRSIREKDAFKFMIRELENLFSFDRIRMYIVDEEKNLLKGTYAAYRTGIVSDISHEVMPMIKGECSLVDVLMSESDIVIKEGIAYLPLRIDYKNKGLLVADNLLSRLEINGYHLNILRSFSSLMAIAFENVFLFEKIQRMSLYDELTGLALRRYFNQRFQEEFYRAERFSQNLSVVFIDIDYFKEINDSYGHQVGDVVLKEIANTIKRNLRKIDFPVRYGGDEIVILLPQSCELEAMGLAKRLLEAVRLLRINLNRFQIDKEITLSISIGIASYPQDAKTMQELIARADEALYWVKSHEKNGVMSYSMMRKLLGKPL
ncbi:MAG: GGDEF domain-containing protein [Elusimicrobiales bacterium]